MATVVLGAVAGVALVSIGVAATWWGGGWVWPSGGRNVGAAVMGLLRGELGEGYSEVGAARLAGAVPTYAAVGIGELLLAAGAVLAGLVGRDRIRSAGSGMASRRQAEHALGVSRLRSARAVIRPDLHR